jgi:hypothetical protein
MPATEAMPEAGSREERARFEQLQRHLAVVFRDVLEAPEAPRTVVVVPGLSLDQEVLEKVPGFRCYEERLLSMLMFLRQPNTKVVFITSEPISQVIVDYYLSFLSGVPGAHARKRLVMLSAHDASPVSLTRKILDRPRLLARIAAEVRDPDAAYLSVFNAGDEEVTLATRLGICMYACDPALAHWGGKTGSRQAFAEAGVAMPAGEEGLRDLDAACAAIVRLRESDPDLARVVVKVNEGFSGEGNALLDLRTLADTSDAARLREALPDALRFEARDMDFDAFESLFRRHGGIVEAWIEGEDKRTPSVQLRITPVGEVELLSSHDQVMGGPSGQVFKGSTFPADERYARDIQDLAARVGVVLRDKGVVGRAAVDFVSVPKGEGFEHHAIEINLRKGGTTMPFQMLEFLTNGHYEPEQARFVSPTGQARFYYASDNVANRDYRRLVPDDLIDVVVSRHLHFDETRQQGVVFNLIGALSEYGKLGMICIADSPEQAEAMFTRTVEVLDQEAAAGVEGLPPQL